MNLTVNQDDSEDSDLYNNEVLTSTSTFAFESIDVNGRQAWLEALQKDNYPCVVAEIDGERDVRKRTIGWCAPISASRRIQCVSLRHYRLWPQQMF